MKIWLLDSREDFLHKDDDPWIPWYDKAFGFVVIAETEDEARELASEQAGDEADGDFFNPWMDEEYSTCVELKPEGVPRVVLRNFKSA